MQIKFGNLQDWIFSLYSSIKIPKGSSERKRLNPKQEDFNDIGTKKFHTDPFQSVKNDVFKNEVKTEQQNRTTVKETVSVEEAVGNAVPIRTSGQKVVSKTEIRNVEDCDVYLSVGKIAQAKANGYRCGQPDKDGFGIIRWDRESLPENTYGVSQQVASLFRFPGENALFISNPASQIKLNPGIMLRPNQNWEINFGIYFRKPMTRLSKDQASGGNQKAHILVEKPILVCSDELPLVRRINQSINSDQLSLVDLYERPQLAWKSSHFMLRLRHSSRGEILPSSLVYPHVSYFGQFIEFRLNSDNGKLTLEDLTNSVVFRGEDAPRQCNVELSVIGE